MFPKRDRLLSGQQSSTSSRLLYDGLPFFLGCSPCSSSLWFQERKTIFFETLEKIRKGRLWVILPEHKLTLPSYSELCKLSRS